MKHIKSKLAPFKSLLKIILSTPLIYPAYQIIRKHLTKSRIFFLIKRILLKRKGYLKPSDIAKIRDIHKSNAGNRSNSLSLLINNSTDSDPLTIGFIITENNPSTIYGDYFTAHGLGDELKKFGYRIVYLPERPVYEWHRLSSIDLLVVMRHTFDPILLRNYPGIISIAWIRGYVDEWCRNPWFKDYDIVIASSEKSLRYAEQFTDSEKCLAVLRLAVDADKFKPGPPVSKYEADISFVGNLFEVPREFSQKLTIPSGISFNFYGRLENKRHRLNKYHRGEVSHSEISRIYNSSKIVLEDCTPMCKPWGCINGRTFEAMSCGACVISNEVPGLKELFGDAIVTYKDRQDLNSAISFLLANEEKRMEIGIQAREKIIRLHTYKHRSREFRDILTKSLASKNDAPPKVTA
ncbi:MAG: glycosyltransferase [Bacteroidales bacterium]|nr:glycosyltransferase [Bacteroidales bacterium]